MPTLKEIILPLIPPIVVLFFHTFMILSFDIYNLYPWFDIPMHILGGMAISVSALIAINSLRKHKEIFIKKGLLEFIIIISFVSLAAVVWELLEFSLDYIYLSNFQASLKDTMLDLFLGLVGGILGILTVKIIRR